MDPRQRRRAEKLAAEALELDRSERSTFIEQSCEGDPLLTQTVRRLIRDRDRSQADRSEKDVLRIAGYQILRTIGRGGMGVVYEAFEEELDRRVALKILPGNVTASERELERFRREASIAGRLDHPGIVKVYRIGESYGNVYFAMDLIDGESLQAFLERQRSRIAEGRSIKSILDSAFVKKVVEWILHAADALQAAHWCDVVHRDIKPSNILISSSGRVMMTDFGLAREQSAQTLTVAGEFLGTPAYMSPEQALASRVAIDHRTDIYSLGITLYECLTLSTPFAGDSIAEVLQQISFKNAPDPRSVNANIQADLANVVLKAIEKDPNRRYASMKEFAVDLRAWLSSEPVSARPIGRWRKVHRAVRRHPNLVAVGSSLVLALVIGSIGSYLYLSSGRYLDIVDLPDGSASVRILEGRPDWRIFGFPRLLAQTGLQETDVRETDRTSFRQGMSIPDDGVDHLLEKLLVNARIRVLDLLGRDQDLLSSFRSAFTEDNLEEMADILDWGMLLGRDDIWEELLRADLSELESSNRVDEWALNHAWNSLDRWQSLRFDERVVSATRARLTGSEDQRRWALKFLASVAPRTPELADELKSLLGSGEIVRNLGWKAATLRLLWHLEPEDRRSIILSWMDDGNPADLVVKSLPWLDRPEDAARVLAYSQKLCRQGVARPWDIARLAPRLARDALSRIVDDPEVAPTARAQAIGALAGFLGPRDAATFERWLDHPDSAIRLLAAASMVALAPEPGALNVLTSALGDERLPIRQRFTAASALLYVFGDQAIAALEFILRNASPEGPWGAWEPLASLAIRSKAAREIMEREAASGEGPGRSLAALGLAWGGFEAAPDALLAGVTSDYPWSRTTAWMLGAMVDARAAARLFEALEAERDENQAYLQRAIVAALQRKPAHDVIPLLSSPSAKIRYCAVVALSLSDSTSRHELELMGEPPKELNAGALAAREVVLRLRSRGERHRIAHDSLRDVRMSETKGSVVETYARASWMRRLVEKRFSVPYQKQRGGSMQVGSVPMAPDYCPGVALFVLRFFADNGWRTDAVRAANQLIADDPRWYTVLETDPELDELRKDPRLARLIQTASRRALLLGDFEAGVGPWSREGLDRHGLDNHESASR